MPAGDDIPARAADGQRGLTGAQSAQRTVDLLLLVAKSESGATPGELAQALGVERQIVYHLLQTLKPIGWVAQGSGGRWCLGPAGAIIEQGLRVQTSTSTTAVAVAPATTATVPAGELPTPSGAWLMTAGENHAALLSSVRGRAALAALEELDSYWDF